MCPGLAEVLGGKWPWYIKPRPKRTARPPTKATCEADPRKLNEALYPSGVGKRSLLWETKTLAEPWVNVRFKRMQSRGFKIPNLETNTKTVRTVREVYFHSLYLHGHFHHSGQLLQAKKSTHRRQWAHSKKKLLTTQKSKPLHQQIIDLEILE